MSPKFIIEPRTLANVDFSVNIPVYQRPYCWDKSQIEQLLSDFQDNIGEEIYFIGNIISIKNNNTYDLIDGQQRFTTLWIIALYIYSLTQDVRLLQFCKLNESPRLNFSIREKTNEYLKELLAQGHSEKGNGFWKISELLSDSEKMDLSSDKDPMLQQNNNIANAFTICEQWFRNNLKHEELNNFASFIVNKVKFQFLTAPENTDENNLFIQINTNSTQFQHYDILKAELINCLPEDKRSQYAKLWDSAAAPYYSNVEVENNEEVELARTATNIFEIIDFAEASFQRDEKEHTKTNVFYPYLYIIDFNTLLIHTLFIYCKLEKKPLPTSFNTEKLLEVFQEFRNILAQDVNEKAKIATGFLDVLKTVKKLLNDHFIFNDIKEKSFSLIPEEAKSKKNDCEDDIDLPVSINERKTSAQLQRLLYHSNNDKKHYWIGIMLDFYISSKSLVTIANLEKIDNILSIKGRTFDSYLSYFEDSAKFIEQEHSFNQNKEQLEYGKVNHYWFYKLEYLLWKSKSETDVGQNYTIISRTSVEHVLPQKRREEYKSKGINIDEFGNLILITVSENSHFSDKNLLEKDNYRKKLTNQPLKMIELFNALDKNNLIKEEPTDTELDTIKIQLDIHKKHMINMLESHYNR